MKIEVLLYVYLSICGGMIVFNIISALLTHGRDKWVVRVSKGFEERIQKEMRMLEINDTIFSHHKKYLIRKLKRIGNMMGFDAALEKVYEKKPKLVRKYLLAISSVFIAMVIEYRKKNSIEMAYYPYLIKKYRLIENRPFGAILDMLYDLLHEPSIYVRENAMQAIYSIGDVNPVIEALKILDREGKFYHNKLLTDGLLQFIGDPDKLSDALWESFSEFSPHMQLTILNYIRFSSDKHCEAMLKLMNDENVDDENRFACLRYFGKYYCESALPHLIKYADGKNGLRWEYSAIASSVLATYPTVETIELLKSNLYHRNWYIRFNSSQSLEKMGLTYIDLIDVIEGKDRFASEILRYRFDVREIITEAKGVSV